MSVAIVTGASRGLGEAISTGLASTGWSLVIDGRDAGALAATEDRLALIMAGDNLRAVPGDITDPGHRRDLVEAAAALGGLDLLVNNAGTLGASPLPAVADYPLDELRAALEVNVVAQLGLIQAALPLLLASPRPRLINVTSDAAVEPYEGWSGYGAGKAASSTWAPCWPSNVPRSPCGRSTRATCARPCTRRPSRVRTSRIDPNQPPSSPPFWISS